ncbi:MAG: hypothetical protein IKP12_07755 [Acholeplasmatales bacterium]|nr:hypothetical protein [Acholeplasmatales bacterium]
MSDFSPQVKDFIDELNSFINQYENLDDKDPLTMNLLKEFKKMILHFNNISSEYTSDLKKYRHIFDKQTKQKLETNKLQSLDINTKLNVALDIIKSKYSIKNEELKKLTKEAKDEYKNTINNLDLDVNFFITSSNQKSEIYADEYEENVKKYNYQIEAAQDSYDLNIRDFNENYEDEFDELLEEYNEKIKKLDFETNKINEHLQSRINEYNNLLEKYLNNLKSVNFETKEKNRKESVALNQEIKVLIDERNEAIVKARDAYSNNLNNSTSAKEEKHQEYQTLGQRLQKEFVISISEQDEFSNNCKKDFDSTINDAKREYYYNDLKETLKQNKLLEDLYNEPQDEKLLKKRLKIKNKYYYLRKQEYRKLSEKNLNNIECDYQIKAEDIRYNKTILELNKNHNIKIINNKEQTDNKYYQELNSIYENEMNLAIKAANIKYTQKANNAKCESRIRLKNIEKESDIAETNLQKNIEGLNTEIIKLQTEIDLNTRLRDLTYQYETERYENNKKNINVSNTLEIEKCKILNNYNKRQFADNILISKAVLDHGKQKLELENKKCIDVHDVTIDIEKEKLNEIINKNNYKIKFNHEYQSEDEQIQIRNTRYEIDVLKNNLSLDRYKFEIKLINQALSTLINLSKELEAFSEAFFNEFFENIQIRPEYQRMITNFINIFENIISKYYEEILNNFSFNISQIVQDRLKFDESNKFKHYYNDLEKQRQADLKTLNNKKNAIEETIKTYNESLQSYSNRVFNIRNQRELVKQKINAKDTKNKESLKIEFRNYNQKIKEFTSRFEEVSKLRDSTNIELEKINIKIEKASNEYDKRLQEIKTMQSNASSAYYNLDNDIKKYIQTIIVQKLSFKNIYEFDFNILTDSHIRKEIQNRSTILIDDNKTIFAHIYDIVNEFRQSIVNTMQKDKELLFTKFQNDIFHISLRTNNIIQELTEEMDEKIDEITNKINQLENKRRNIINKYDQQFAQANNAHNEEIERINHNKQNSLNRFYSEFYSMCRNEDFLTSVHNATIKGLDNDNIFKKQRLNIDALNKKKEAVVNLDQFIESKESLINHLPVATKFFVDNVSKEKDEANQNLDLDLKNARLEAYQNKKLIEKNIASIELTGNLENDMEKANFEKNLILEKRKHNRIIKKIDKTKIEFNI